jgi:hypothetical protein
MYMGASIHIHRYLFGESQIQPTIKEIMYQSIPAVAAVPMPFAAFLIPGVGLLPKFFSPRVGT